MQFSRRRGSAALILLGLGGVLAALSAGCGSSSTSPTAHIRGADFAVNGGTSGVIANNTAVGGDLTYAQVSPYSFVADGLSTFFFATTTSPPTTTVSGATVSVVVPPNVQFQLNNGSYYTAYLIGRSDVKPLSALRPDPRFLQTVVTGSKGAAANYQAQTGAAPSVYAEPPAGQANVRILNAAPDAGPVDIVISGKTVFPAVAYPVLPAGLGGSNVPALNPATGYLPQPSGTLSVQVNAAGTSTALVPATSLSVSAGQSYTILITEPSVAPTYSLSVQTD